MICFSPWRGAALLAIIIAGMSSASGQTPASTPTPQASPTPSLERKFLKNILRDQRAIWTSPLHLQGGDAKWLVPLGLSTAALIATDRRTADALDDNRTRLNVMESGFASLDAPEHTRNKAFDDNTKGWRMELDALKQRAEAQLSRR